MWDEAQGLFQIHFKKYRNILSGHQLCAALLT
jgi:hypothetical protein